MNKGIASKSIVLGIITIMIGMSTFPMIRTVSAGDTIYVPDDYSTIQTAVNAAVSGDTIIVRDGLYIENVVVFKNNLIIRSENGAGTTTVQASTSIEHVFTVTANYVKIIGFTVKRVYLPSGYGSGIFLNGATNCEISKNTIDFNSHGIALVTSNNNILTNNMIHNTGTGISLRDSSNYNTVKDNTLESNTIGIYLYNLVSSGSHQNTITRNKMINNNYYGINLRQSNNNFIYLNDFINNFDNAYSESSTNNWNSPEQITYTHSGITYMNYLGNFWGDYNGGDVDNDGIGDTPYTIGDDTDDYPLMQSFKNYIGGGNQPPVAEFSYLPENPKAGEQIILDASDSIDYDGEIILYSWDLDADGTYDRYSLSTQPY